MSKGKLWAVSTRGNVYTLDVGEREWHPIHNEGQHLRGFKKVSSCKQGAWGLGCDHQVYVFIYPSDVAIRCQEVTYENERWIVTRGWSGKHLLPVDPWHWSNDDCTVHLPKEDFKLPSDNWEWEGDWYVDENVHGHMTDKGGWRYGNLDFHHEFTHRKTIASCVRRRRWIRYRIYIATGRWARISGFHMDPLEEPIVDLSVGGQDLPNQPAGFTALWAVTIDGKVLFRSGVSQSCPEGQSWQDIVTEEDHEAISVSVGPTGMVWAATWSGGVLVRVGIDWHNAKGTAWLNLDAPDPTDKVLLTAIGVKAAWVCVTSGKVWFRKGIDGSTGDRKDESAVCGDGWLQMVNQMRVVAIGPRDQLWAIDLDRQLQLRSGVSVEEQSGRRWQCLDLPAQNAPSSRPAARPCSTPSSLLPQSAASPADTGSSPALSAGQGPGDTCRMCGKVISGSARTGTPSAGGGFPEAGDLCVDCMSQKCISGHLPQAMDSATRGPILDLESSSCDQNPMNIHTSGRILKIGESDINCDDFDGGQSSSKKNVRYATGRNCDAKNDHQSTRSNATAPTSKKNLSDISVSFSKSDVGLKVQFVSTAPKPERESTPPLVKASSGGSHDSDIDLRTAAAERAEQPAAEWRLSRGDSYADFMDASRMTEDTQPDSPGNVQWVWVSANVCTVADESSIKHWFTRETGSRSSLYLSQLNVGIWRESLLAQLHQRNKTQCHTYYSYPLAVEKTGWSKKGVLRWWCDNERHAKWVESQVELTQDTDSENKTEKSGAFAIQYKKKNLPKTLLVDLDDIMCVCILADPQQNAAFGAYLSSRMSASPRAPVLRLAATSEEEMEDWVAALSIACCDQRGLHGSPYAHALWAVTERGDVFVHEPQEKDLSEITSNLFWHQYGGHLQKVETCPVGQTWGIGHNGTAWVYTGGYGGAFFKGMATSTYDVHPQSDVLELCVYENQRWRPVRGYTDRVLWRDSYAWSDETGQKECTKEGTKLASKHWQWVTDWLIDRRLSGGVDQDGWQYCKDIKGPFHAKPKINSSLRRRRWLRKCELLTSGPWLEVGPLPLLDLSLQLDSLHDDLDAPLAVWAVGANGDVLCRLGVTQNTPTGQAWQHVLTDQAFTAISVGASHRVWATARDGSAWLRVGITAHNVTGDYWIHIPPPKGGHLTQVSVGLTDVWAIDTQGNLWYREGVASSVPEGSSWLSKAKKDKVNHISCGLQNQLWAIVSGVSSKTGAMDGVLARRSGRCDADPKCAAWDYGIGGGIQYVCARS